MGLGNHKRKMSISLSITLIPPHPPHTMANLVQMHSRERKSTTAHVMHPLYSQSPRVQNAARAPQANSRFDGQRYTVTFLSVSSPFCICVFTGLENNTDCVFLPEICLGFYLYFYLQNH